MRKPSGKPSDDEDDKDKRARHKHLLKKHPNKHNEGDRKRWRDAVTERERKRYEGVWAANKGLYTAPADRCQNAAAEAASPEMKAYPEKDLMSNLVVGPIWRRSRLGKEILAQIWDLVDRRMDGCLTREEFVVGMWLVDQRLKGRKLPVKVGASVWESVRSMGGVKVKMRG
jgi:hypothetical protein